MDNLEKEIQFIKDCPDYTIFAIDLFCGAGGETSGIEAAMVNGHKCAKVIACVNHDENAIKSHAANHKDVLHYIEDIRTLNLGGLEKLVDSVRKYHPGSFILLHGSLECTNFSRAKGGQPRDADSRTLADHLFRYIEALNPDYIQIENVEEFMCWGDLDERGKPVSKDRGRCYLRWVRKVCSYGYRFDYRILNAADFGAYTSRRRFFGQFARKGLPIVFPEPTYSKTGDNDLFHNFKKWKPVREVLDLANEGESIFGRKKPLVEKTLERIYAGLVKFVAGGEDRFLLKWNSTNGKTGKHVPPSIDEPCPTVACQNRLGLAKVQFLSKQYSGDPKGKNISIEQPAGTVTTKDHHAFITAYYGNGYNQSLEDPAGTITTKDRFALITSQFLSMQYGNGFSSPLDNPSPTITGRPKQQLISVDRMKFVSAYYTPGYNSSVEEPVGTVTTKPRFYQISPQFLANPYSYKSDGCSIEKPCFTLIARMDKCPPYLISTEKGLAIAVFDDDSPMTCRIKQFMALYGIADIKMRMLNIVELKRIMGFPEDYILVGTQAEKLKYVGNAVEVNMSRVLCEALAAALPSSQQAAV